MAVFRDPFSKNEDSDVDLFYRTGVQALQSSNWSWANTCFRKAALQGHVSALFNLSIINGAGYVTPYDLDFAIDCFYKAAAAGHPAASGFMPYFEGAERGGLGTKNLAKFAESIQVEDGLNHIMMMCAARFYDVLCKKFGATNDVIAYELDAAVTSANPAILRFVKRTGVSSSFYAGGLNRLKSGSAADQITDGLNELHFGMKSSGMKDNMCLMARCTIVGHIILNSPYAAGSQPLKGVENFYRQ